MTRITIKKRILIIQMIVIIISFIIMTIYNYRIIRKNLETMQLQLLEKGVIDVNNKLKDYSEEIMTYAMLIASRSELKEVVSESKDIESWDTVESSNILNYPNEVMNKNVVSIISGHRDKKGDTKEDKLINDVLSGTVSSGVMISNRTGQ